MPKISIIVPIYNVEKYLKKCIESIINQTLDDLELILVNDGSEDNSAEICDDYVKRDKRIIVIHKENGGVSSARNAGIDVAKGQFIGFVDPDDYLEMDALEYLYNMAINNKADIVCYRMKTYKNMKLPSYESEKECIKCYYGKEIINQQLKYGEFLHSTCNKLYSNKFFYNLDNRFYSQIRYAEDALFNYKIMLNANVLVSSNLRKYNYLINESGVVSNISLKRLDVFDAQIEIYNLLKNDYKNAHIILNEYVNSSISLIIDIARSKNNTNNNYEILQGLKIKLIRDKNILNSIELQNKKQKILFRLVKSNPNLLIRLYKIRFYILNMKG